MSDQTPISTTPASPLGEISQEPPALEQFLDKHQMKLIALAAILAILASIYVVYEGIQEGAQIDAGELLVAAEDTEDLKAIVADHGRTAAALSAKILLAEKQWENGEKEAALATLRAFASSDATHPARPSAEASLAAKLWSEGKLDEAANIFQRLADDEDARYLAPYAWTSLGDIRAEQGNLEAAEAAYGNVEEKFPTTNFGNQAGMRKQIVKAEAPIEVEKKITVPDVKFGEGAEGAASGELNPREMDLKNFLETSEPAEGQSAPETAEESSTEPTEEVVSETSEEVTPEASEETVPETAEQPESQPEPETPEVQETEQ